MITMRECLSCKKAIPESRRKNAMYCDLPACRAREYRRRKRETEKTSAPEKGKAGPTPARHDSMVITCSCGNRLLVQVSHLGPAELPEPSGVSDTAISAKLPEQVPSASADSRFTSRAADIQSGEREPDAVTTNGTRQEKAPQGLASGNPTLPAETCIGPPSPHLVVQGDSGKPAGGAPSEASASHVLESASEALHRGAEKVPSKTQGDTEQTSAQLGNDPSSNRTTAHVPRSPHTHHALGGDVSQPAGVFSSGTLTAASSDISGFRTCELYGVIAGQVVHLSRVLFQLAHSRVINVRIGADVRATMRPTEGFGLAGEPGRWRDFYEWQSPTWFGLEADLAAMYQEEETGRGMVLPANVLANLLGWQWKEKLRSVRR